MTARRSVGPRNSEPQLSPLIYVAGPFSKGVVSENVHHAVEAGHALMDRGYTPFIPHATTHLANMIHPRPQEEWLEYDRRWLLACAAVLQLPGESAGTNVEVDLARRRGIPVFTSIDELDAFFGRQTYRKTLDAGGLD